MKPPDGKYQTATQVKVLSPEIFNIEEVDSLHMLEDRMNCIYMARCNLLLRGLSPWYGIEWMLREPGRPGLLPQKRISENNSKRRGLGDGSSGVGLTHSRGVAGVMPCGDTDVHSKGSALICKGAGTRSPITELEELWKRN